MWLVVLTGFLAPSACSPPGTRSTRRTKEFYFFFLLQQTAMLGVFVSLDLFLYYAFWELSLVPMAILIAMFGRERGTARRRIKFFLYTFIPSALLLVGDSLALRQNRHLRLRPSCKPSSPSNSVALPAAGALLGLAGLPRRLRRQGSGLSRCTAGSPMSSAKRPPPWPWSSPASLASTPSCASISASSLRSRGSVAPLDDRAGRRSASSTARCVALVQNDLKRLLAFATLSSPQLLHARHLLPSPSRAWTAPSTRSSTKASPAARSSSCSALCTTATAPTRSALTAASRQAHAPPRHPVRHHCALADRPAHAQRLRRRVPHPQRQLRLATSRLGRRRHHRRHPQRGLHALDDPARLLRCRIGAWSQTLAAHDLRFREHLALWPMAVLMLVMGVVSPSGCAPSTARPCTR